MESDHEDEGKEGLAKDRTNLAEDRTLLAHERSFAGWARTGMAAIGIGLGFNALFGTMNPDWVAKAIATAFLVVAGSVFISSERRARRQLDKLESHEVSVLSARRIRYLSWSLTLLSAALAAAIWLLVEPVPDGSAGDRGRASSSDARPAPEARGSPPQSGAAPRR